MLKKITYLAALMLSASFLLEYGFGFKPCLICELQRLILIPIIFTLIVDNLNMHIIGHGLLRLSRLVCCAFACYLSLHHLKLIMQPTLGTSCMPKLLTIVSMQGITQTWHTIFAGSTACNTVQLEILGINLAEITLFLFALLLMLILLEIYDFLKYALTNKAKIT